MESPSVPFAIVDAFTASPFAGNPAAVCLLDEPAPLGWMQAIATEFNLPMTAFVEDRADGHFNMRWFTPKLEVEICGHATLAAAHVLGGAATFHTAAGRLPCARTDDGWIELDFPAIPVAPLDDLTSTQILLNIDATRLLSASGGGQWWLAEVASTEDLRGVRPDRDALVDFGGVLVVVCTPGESAGADSACRVFEPAAGLDEDPVTGSAHCVIAPWLSIRTGRTEFDAEQLSERGGRVQMRVRDDRVMLRGQAVTIASGTLHIPPGAFS